MEDFEIKEGILVKCHIHSGEIAIPEGVISIDNSAFSLKGNTNIILPDSIQQLKPLWNCWWFDSHICCIEVCGLGINLSDLGLDCYDLDNALCICMDFTSKDYEANYENECYFPDQEDYICERIPEYAGDSQWVREVEREWEEDYEKHKEDMRKQLRNDIWNDIVRIMNRDFDSIKCLHVVTVCCFVTKMFLAHPEDEKICNYIKKHFAEMINSFDEITASEEFKTKMSKLCECNQNIDAEKIVEEIISSGKFCPAGGKLVKTPDGFLMFDDTLYRYSGKEKDVIIPDTIKIISSNAFNGCKKITSVLISETVTDIAENAFQDCKKLTKVTFFCDGHQFEIYSKKAINFADVMHLLKNKDYAYSMKKEIKYILLFQIFTFEMDSENVTAYIKKNFKKMFQFLIDADDVETIQKILDADIFVKKSNIDNYINYAIDNQKYEAQIILTNYKAQKNWYDNNKFRL